MEPTTLLLVHAAATWAMVGLIWFVQVVHYPLFAFVPQQGFTEWQQANLPRTTKVVLPPMAVEFLCTLLLLFEAPERLQPLAWTGAALLAFVWLSTVFLQVPCHGTIEVRRDEAALRRLCATNWLRTIGWTARGVIAALMLVPLLEGS